jgi:hypothetical protein
MINLSDCRKKFIIHISSFENPSPLPVVRGRVVADAGGTE